MSTNSAPYTPDGAIIDNWLTTGTKPQMNPVLAEIVGADNQFFAPAQPSTPAPTQQNPLSSLATPQSQATHPNNAEFDNLVNDILNESPSVQDADTPMDQQSSTPKPPKSGPLFGDLNINLPPPHTQVKTEEERNRTPNNKESIF